MLIFPQEQPPEPYGEPSRLFICSYYLLWRFRSKCVRFSPTGRSFAAVTVEGLLIYSLDNTLLFDPFLLDIDITPASVRETLAEGNYLLALLVITKIIIIITPSYKNFFYL